MKAKTTKDYHDVPGTYVLDGEHCRLGYALNKFCMSLNKQSNRDKFRANEANYLDQYDLDSEQRAAVLKRDWLGLLQLGGNVYYTFKLAIFDGLSMQAMGGAMSQISEQEFQQMMISGGRPIAGNRSKKEMEHS